MTQKPRQWSRTAYDSALRCGRARRAHLFLGSSPLLLGDQDFAPVDGTTHLQQTGNLSCKRAQVVGLLVRQTLATRFGIDHAQRAEHLPLGRAQRRYSVEAEMRLACDEGIAGGARIRDEIRNDEEVGLGEDELADGAVEVGLAVRKADVGFEPLAVGGDETDQGDRYRAEPGGEPHDVVEALLGRGVEDAVSVEGGEPVRIVRQGGMIAHGAGRVGARGGLGRSAGERPSRMVSSRSMRRRSATRTSSLALV